MFLSYPAVTRHEDHGKLIEITLALDSDRHQHYFTAMPDPERTALLQLLASALLIGLTGAAWLWPEYRFLICVAAGTLLGILALWLVPKWQVARLKLMDPRDLFQQENEARKTLAQVIGGILVLAGLYYTNENIKITQNAADQTQRAATESRELTRQGQLTDRFTKAVEQLGKQDSEGKNSSLPTRLGGIYALERIAKESKEDHWPIIELLIQYLSARPSEKDHVTPEAQAILTALGRRKVEYENPNQKIFLTNLNLKGAWFTGSFQNAAFDGSNLEHARLFDVNLQRSSFTMTHLSFTRFDGVNLKEVVFNSPKFAGTPGISRSDLTFTDFIDTNMSGVIGLNCEDVKTAKFSDKTILPTSLDTCNIKRTTYVEYYRGK
jgi:hypothetical protein